MQNLGFKNLKGKLNEALSAVLPIVALVMVLCFSIAPISSSTLLSFLMGAAMIIAGMMFFSLGAEMAMSPIGQKTGTAMTKTRKIWLIVIISFVLGFIITISEPDLSVLADQLPSIPSVTMIVSVAVGVGVFLVIATLRMFFSVPLPPLLITFYLICFILARFVDPEFLGVSFDSGGVTTGPLTVPFIMAFGVGISRIRSDRHAADDSFGLVAICSIGPILAMELLCMIFKPDEAAYEATVLPDIASSTDLAELFGRGLPGYTYSILLSLLPIVIFFLIFQLVILKLSRRTLLKIAVGFIYTCLGLILFLTGANVGFVPAGNYIGQALAGGSLRWIAVPISMLMGFFIVRAEPAVYVLNKQVEEITDGAIPAHSIGLALSIGVACSLGLSMVRVLTGISIMWFLVPGYAIALGISFFVPRIYTAIAFDSGGVASGPMTSTFLLPFAQGVCIAVGGDIVSDAFGVVAMVAMTPLITIQIMGLLSTLRAAREVTKVPTAYVEAFMELPEDAIIEL